MIKRYLVLVSIVVLAGSLLTPFSTHKYAEAANAANWQAGRIIDDAVFTDANAMSAWEVQHFLNQKVGTGGYGRIAGQCDTNGAGTSEYGGGTRAQYGAAHGNPSPFTCLKDFYEVPKTTPSPGIPANNYGGKAIPAGAKSAAQIIWDAARQYNISPKTLLVTIQKESAGPLTTDDWPFEKQYTYAMGAHCPDTAPCDSNYAGFSMQIYESARLFRYYIDNMSQSWWPYKKPGNNSVLYNPNSSCGSSNVFITGRATAALYTYTPYQPNQAALNNLYGSGDGCSAYGNRNFWRIFTDWFGTTYANGYEARAYSQSPYPTIYNGETKTVNIQYTNLGSARWYDDLSVPAGGNPVHLAATNPINRTSGFSSTWPSPGRATSNFARVYESNGVTLASNQHAVEPGQIAVFEFQISANNNIAPGTYREYFQPVLEGAAGWNLGGQAWLDITVVSPYKAAYHSQSAHPTIVANNNVKSSIMYKNAGTAYWYDDLTAPTNNTIPVHLATTSGINRSSIFSASWPSPSRPTGLFAMVYASDGVTPSQFQHVVRPGEVVRFDFDFTARDGTGTGMYREFFQLVLEGAANWDVGGVAWSDVTVAGRGGNAQFHLQSNYPTSAPGQANPSFLSYKNTTNYPWYDEASAPKGVLPVHLATTAGINRYSAFSYGWPTNSRPALTFNKVYESDGSTLAQNQHIVQPGQIGRFDFNLTTPWSSPSGLHREYFQPLVEGSPNWNIGGVSWLDVNVIR